MGRPETGSAFRRHLEAAFGAARVAFHPAVEVGNLSLVRRFVAASPASPPSPTTGRYVPELRCPPPCTVSWNCWQYPDLRGGDDPARQPHPTRRSVGDQRAAVPGQRRLGHRGARLTRCAGSDLARPDGLVEAEAVARGGTVRLKDERDQFL